jgi:hypothetical protein
MPVLESKLIIGAKDETGGAFAAIKERIAGLDKQVATFDKLMAATRKVASANDPMIAGIDRAARSLQEEKVAAEALSRAMSLGVGSAEEMSAVQSRLARSTSEATRAMTRQADEAVIASRRVKKEAKGGGLVGMGGGLVGMMVGYQVGELGIKAIEAGATLDQTLAKLRTSGTPAADIDQARAGYADFAKTHVGMTEAEYLTKFSEARTMSTDPLKTTREMAQLSLALKNSGVETTPDEVRSFVKSVDEMSLPPAEQEKLLDRFAKIKQLYGNNITGETYLAAQRRSSMSAYGWDDKFRENYFPFMLQSLGVTSGNDMMTAYSNYVGKHMQHTELMNLAKYGFIRPEDEVLNKVGDIKGLKPGAKVWEEDVMKSNPAQFAWDMHQKFMSHKGATEDQFSSFVATLPRAMGAMIEFFTHGQGMAARDLALGKNPVGLAAAGSDYAANNPIAALGALRTSIEQFGAALTSGPVQQAGKQLVDLSRDITAAAANVSAFEKDHPGATKAGTYATEVGGGLLALGVAAKFASWIGGGLKSVFTLGGLLSRGGGAVAGAVAGGEAGAEAGALGGPLGSVALGVGGLALGAALNTPTGRSLVAAVTDKVGEMVFGPASAAPKPTEHNWGPWHAGGSPSGPIMPKSWTPSGVSLSGGADNAKLAAAAAMPVNVQGQAELQQTLNITIQLDPEIRAQIMAARSASVTIPLIGGGSGRMDSDAGPHRSGIGSM